MERVPLLAVLLSLTLCILPSRETTAQDYNDSGVVYEAARNKLGLIRYCRKNGLLDPASADHVLLVMVNGMSKLAPGSVVASAQGDRAEKAGEDGFWDAGRRRDIAAVAKLFHTTPAELCQEWAIETLRAQAQKRSRELAAIPASARVRQPAPKGVAPVKLDPRAADPTKLASAPPPPLPERAPLQPGQAYFAAWQRSSTLPERLLPPPRTLARTQPIGTQLAPKAKTVREAEELAEAEKPLSRERTAGAAPPRLYGEAPALAERRPVYRRGPAERCLMPGCRWPTPQERDYWRY